MAFTDEITDFTAAYTQIQKDSMVVGGVYDKAIDKITEQFDGMSGLTASEKAKLIAQIAGSLATNISNSAQQTAMALVMQPHKAAIENAQKLLIDNQAATELKKADLLVRQATGFDDKKKVDKAKALADVVGLTSNATGTLNADLLLKLNTALDAI
jgi:electron transfer flavoprotein alpha subunit